MSFVDEYRELVASHERENSMRSKRALLDHLCNGQHYDTQSGTMEVQILDRQTQFATKWTPWLEARENDWLVANCNNRSVGMAEVVFDIDPEEGEDKTLFEKRIEETKAALIKKNAHILGDYTTGSRGRHIHILLEELALHRKSTIEKIKRILLTRYRADTAKAITRCMILIEGSTNTKTGRPKRRIA